MSRLRKPSLWVILFGTWEEVLDQLLSVCCMHNFVKNLIFREEICLRKWGQKISTIESEYIPNVWTKMVLDVLLFNKIYTSRGCGMRQAYQKRFRLASFLGKSGVERSFI